MQVIAFHGTMFILHDSQKNVRPEKQGPQAALAPVEGLYKRILVV